jgi:membrane-associated phospholipid phosphatase
MSLLTATRPRPRSALVAIAASIGFIAVGLAVRAGLTDAFDTAALDALARLHGTPLDPVMVAISEIGVADVLAFFTMIPAGLLWSIGLRRAAVFVVAGYYVAAVATDVVKAAIARPRPPVTYQIPLRMSETEDLIWAALAILLVVALWRTRLRWGAVIGAVLFALTVFIDPATVAVPGMDSLPSGHALRSMTLVLTLLIAAPWRPSRRVVVLLATVILAIGLSRVYLGEHHPSDVIAGWLAGIAIAAALAAIPFFSTPEAMVLPEVVSRERSAG